MPSSNGHARKILLVEDEAILALDTASTLKKEGYLVVPAHSGEQAIEAVREDPELSMVLMDIDLGRAMDGTEAARRILELRSLPIVFLTSHSEKSMVDRVRDITRYGYVLKSSGEFVLLESIQMAFELFEAHREVEERGRVYRSIFAHNRAVMLLLDPETGEIVDANAAAVEFYGWSYPELTRKKIHEISLLSRSEIAGNMRKAAAEDKNNFVVKHRTASGAKRDVEVFSRPVMMLRRRLLHVIVYDITEKLESEKEAGRLKRLLEYAVEHDPNAVIVLDDQLRYMFVSRRFREENGLGDRDIIGLRHYDLFPHIPEKWREVHKTVLRGETLRSAEDEVVKPDGAIDYVQWECIPWYRNDDSIGGLILYTEILNQRRAAKKQVERRSENLRTTLRSIADAVISTDAQGCIEQMNPPAERLTGWSREEADGRHLDEVFVTRNVESRRSLPGVARQVLGAAGNGGGRSGRGSGRTLKSGLPVTLVSRHGRKSKVAYSAAPIKDSGGIVCGVVLVFREVTRQYERDRRLVESEAKFRGLFDRAPVGISLTSSTGELLDINPALLKMVRIPTRSEALENYTNVTSQFYVDPSRRAELLRLLERDGKVDDFDFEARMPDGTTRWFNVINAEVTETRPDGTFFVETFSADITKRKLTETAAYEEQRYLQTLLRTTRDGLWVADRDGRIVDVNDAYCAMSGYSRDELIGMHILDINPGERMSDVTVRMKRILQSGHELFETRHRRKDGTFFDVEVSTAYMGTDRGEIVSMFRDVTKRKEAEQDLRKLNAELTAQSSELLRALREKDSLMQEMNHRIKNNLQMVASLLRLKESASKIDLSDVRSQIDAVRIVHEKLHSSENVSSINFREQCDELLNMIFSAFASHEVIFENRIDNVEIATKTAIPLGLIVNEIATNAMKHGFQTPGEARFTIGMTREPETHKFVLVLANSGKAFPSSVDLNNSHTLGLQIVSALVDQIGGTIELRRSPSPEFTIRFPDEQVR